MYIRNDSVEMIEVAPSQAVNVPAALRLHLVTLEMVEAARCEMDQREAAPSKPGSCHFRRLDRCCSGRSP
jgi:hypothetical protein